MNKSRFSPLPARIKILAFAALATTILNRSQTAEAVPTSILLQPTGTQADVQWGRVENDRFVVYYDASQKSLATHHRLPIERKAEA